MTNKSRREYEKNLCETCKINKKKLTEDNFLSKKKKIKKDKNIMRRINVNRMLAKNITRKTINFKRKGKFLSQNSSPRFDRGPGVQ